MLLGINPLRLSTAKRNREPWGVCVWGGNGEGKWGRWREGRRTGVRALGATKLPPSSRQPPCLTLLSATALSICWDLPSTPNSCCLIWPACLWIPASGHWFFPPSPGLCPHPSSRLPSSALYLCRTFFCPLSLLSDLFPLGGSAWPRPKGRCGRFSSWFCCFCNCCGWLQVRWG